MHFKIMNEFSLFYLINCFFIYSFLGWIFESIVMTYENRAITNRGFTRGPFCIIYGLGALSVYILLQPVSESYCALFVCGMVMATVLELVTAKIMTHIFGGFWWNYNNKKFNYHGVICLESSLCWGVMSMCTFAFFQPVVERVVDIYYPSFGRIVALALLSIYALDFSSSFRRALDNPLEQDNNFSRINTLGN